MDYSIRRALELLLISSTPLGLKGLRGRYTPDCIRGYELFNPIGVCRRILNWLQTL